MIKIEKNDNMCYNENVGKVNFSMMIAANYLEDIIYDNEEIKNELSDDKKIGFVNKLQLILIIKTARQILKNKKSKIRCRLDHNKDILNGKTVIKGTRITPEVINNYILKKVKNNVDREKIFEDLLNDYPSIEKEDIIASLIYKIANTSYFSVFFDK